MSSHPLRKDGLLLDRLPWPPNSNEEPPRALRSLARIIEDDLCHRCGSCVGICPCDVLGCDEREFPVVKNIQTCTDCDLCVKVCPGDEFDAVEHAKRCFNHVPDKFDIHGHFDSAYLSFATDSGTRRNSTSGGLVTALLVSMLERKEIDGAIVIASDDTAPWRGKPIVARTTEEIVQAAKSKYAISPTNRVLQEIIKTPGRYAAVGLPCQIHGLHKAAELDRRVEQRLILTIGLFCHAAVDHEPLEFVWNSLGGLKQNVVRFISRVGKHPGTPHVELKDGTLHPVYFPKAKGYRPSSMEILNIMYRLYTPPRCLTCYDATAEFADIAVGDPWMPPPADDIDFKEGYSFVLARTPRAEAALHAASRDGSIMLRELTAEVGRTSNRVMAEEKRTRAFRIIQTHERQGRAIPEYGFSVPALPTAKRMKTELNMLSHFFCFVPWGKETLFRWLFSPLGYGLLWLNNRRRHFRFWLRDSRARYSRKNQ